MPGAAGVVGAFGWAIEGPLETLSTPLGFMIVIASFAPCSAVAPASLAASPRAVEMGVCAGCAPGVADWAGAWGYVPAGCVG